ncbi:hypothetical protein [uncultured Flavonifractor sp.]|uniref:hypothetical protein n=1 Tax=uncultured Flavonifractor sp. TaxID=1193534 RepID=UPI00263838D1|nr:hypothetical protein [uncultured Flavonifractor sp.]
MNIKQRAKKLKSDIPAIFIALKEKDTPLIAKIILLPALVALTIKLIPEEVWIKSKRNAEELWEDGKPKKWYYSIPIIIVWCVLLFAIIKAICFL